LDNAARVLEVLVVVRVVRVDHGENSQSREKKSPDCSFEPKAPKPRDEPVVEVDPGENSQSREKKSLGPRGSLSQNREGWIPPSHPLLPPSSSSSSP